MLIVLLLAAVLATDVAVAMLFFAWRPRAGSRGVPAPDGAPAREIEELLMRLRMQAEQAGAEIGRQKAQLRRVLAGVDQPPAVAQRPAGEPLAEWPAAEPARVLQLAAQGMAPRAIAGHTRVSVEEVRLLIALADGRERRASA